MSNVVGNSLNLFGKATTIYWVLGALSVCLISTSVGSLMLVSPKYTNATTGTVKSVSCTSNVCQGTVLLQNGSSIFVNNLPSGTSVDATVNVYYTSESPPKYSGAQSPPNIVPVSLISSGFLILIIAVLIGTAISKSRTASQVVGGVQLFELFR
jgi:hypothetical protein